VIQRTEDGRQKTEFVLEQYEGIEQGVGRERGRRKRHTYQSSPLPPLDKIMMPQRQISISLGLPSRRTGNMDVAAPAFVHGCTTAGVLDMGELGRK
jgi:hypothetical protein